ncbi:hypothetical protein FRX31_019089, partial [Thalictrum thalictroides]
MMARRRFWQIGLNLIIEALGKLHGCLLPYATLWVLWCIRNHIIFENGVLDVEKAISRVKATIWAWLDMLRRKVDVKKGYRPG